MKKTLLTLSLCAALLGMMTAPASAVVLMDEDVNISFSFSENFNFFAPNPDRYTIDSTAMAYSGTHSLEEAHPEDLNVWGGQSLTFEEQLGSTVVTGAGADASAADRDISQYDDTGKVKLSWWYKILQPVDLNSDGNPANDTSVPNVLPVTNVSLRYNDADNYKLDDDGNVVLDVDGNPELAPANEDVTSSGATQMIVDGEWHQASIVLDVLSPAARAALDQNGNDNSDTISVWRLETNIAEIQTQQIPPNPSDFAGAPTFFFIDLVEMNAIPEPASLGLMGLGCMMMAIGRRRRA